MYVVWGKVMFRQGERRVSPGTTDLISPGQAGKREILVGAWAIQSSMGRSFFLTSPFSTLSYPVLKREGWITYLPDQAEGRSYLGTWLAGSIGSGHLSTRLGVIGESIMISMMRMGYGQFCVVMLMGGCLVFIFLSACLSEKKRFMRIFWYRTNKTSGHSSTLLWYPFVSFEFGTTTIINILLSLMQKIRALILTEGKLTQLLLKPLLSEEYSKDFS